MGVSTSLARLGRRWRAHFDVDPRVPGNRRKARIYNLYFDHAILRTFWTNFARIAPGAYRSNQPTHARFKRLRARGIKTVLNLRGANTSAHFLTEKMSCDALGLTLVSIPLQARAAAPRASLLHLITLLREIERPFVMHCKSGADRAGFASAVYLMVCENQPVDVAHKMLHWRFLHTRYSKTGILDYILDCYAARQKTGPVPFADWVETEYDSGAITAAYLAGHPPT